MLLRGVIASSALAAMAAAESYKETYRPQFHFSPEKNWMNDPNGLLYHDGVYHLFYQYNYGGITWGNMSWGHATSKDLTHWEQLPIAIKANEDASGALTEMIYSGSAVFDSKRSSGFGSKSKPPLVAVYTSNYEQDITLANGKAVLNGQESQSIAFSTDNGLTWTQYAENPVIHEPPSQYADQYQQFRDPFVFWHAETTKWVMVVSLADLHKLLIYTSSDLKDWTNVSEFGPVNAVGGQWECPNLFPLLVDGKRNAEKWVMMIGINPGGPAVPYRLGSATQYVVGGFNGTHFTADSNNVYEQEPPSNSEVFADWSQSTFAAAGWTATGDLVGQGPEDGTVLTLQDGDATVGTLTSPTFRISSNYVIYQFGCCYNPYNATTYGTASDTETAMNLVVNGAVVRTTTGVSGGDVIWEQWDTSDLIGKSGYIEIVDKSTGGYGHLQVGQILFSNSSLPPEANWVDHGPDYYAAATYNGLSTYERVSVGWMSSWAYGAEIPTTPWRSAMSVPRLMTLKTISGAAKLVQQPQMNLASLEKTKPYSKTWSNLSKQNVTLPVTGKLFDITLQFTPVSGKFGIDVRTDGKTQRTSIGYDPAKATMFVDRQASGDVEFSTSFPGVYYGPLSKQKDGSVKLRILLDWSSVEVFGNVGESVITAQIFPSSADTKLALFSTGTAKNVSLKVTPVTSAWV
ncbi:glycosyl hydrolase [Dipodascopsis tothii]|uniref:glycosyl hydrolase n=1 Tax=Dipodascopsis tothii TaxID=44089 RepID=UPI0034CEB640